MAVSSYNKQTKKAIPQYVPHGTFYVPHGTFIFGILLTDIRKTDKNKLPFFKTYYGEFHE